ncbi:hypothetical protein N7474_002849 [Penicillium riverlandense]|uniref:uncharacterized protein n=1 Tax=Penicillium riverlandense TaxID=1903569 RepID=UPI002547C345|nr:uncharacterized protein N7474_002849 [Penicillium riverlandense]KAJ5825711.1 hypothetical protein N7474_002849 [Penicillium riverlandense]
MHTIPQMKILLCFLGPLLVLGGPAHPRNHPAPWHPFTIDTNYYDSIPDTNVVREYWFEIVNTTAAPDGVERPVLLVNGQFPGPAIEANWGDTVKVHVTNRMSDNGTALHFHGVRQLRTNQMDGVASLTQCPIAPGKSYTYVWRAEQYGSSWYHSHFSLQAWEGVYGPIVIHGPATAEYDVDLGVVFLSDWAHQTIDEMYQRQLETYGTPQMEGGLLNGMNVWVQPDGTTVGRRFETLLKPGKKYRIRLINTAMHTHFKFSIDGHDLTVIANDFVPLVPFTTPVVPIGMGQRYDVILTADQPRDNYWMRAVPQTFCSNNTSGDNIKGVVRYAGAPHTDPVSFKWDYGDDVQCEDFVMSKLVPHLPLDADINKNSKLVNSPAAVDAVGDPSLYLWTLGGSAFNVSWQDPTLRQTTKTGKINWTPGQGVVEVEKANEMVVFIIQTYIQAPHPIHLHGHDFFVLAQGLGTYDPHNVTLQTKNPPRRDTAMLPSKDEGGGYLVLAFPADNPGVWLMHCHVGFHATEGFAQQIVERRAELQQFLDREVLERTCRAWDQYARRNPYGVQYTGVNGPFDSGV